MSKYRTYDPGPHRKRQGHTSQLKNGVFCHVLYNSHFMVDLKVKKKNLSVFIFFSDLTLTLNSFSEVL